MEAIFTPGSKPVVMIVSSRWDYEGDDNLCDAMCRTYGTLLVEGMLTPGSKPIVMIASSRWDY